jgi:hypothetical protein
VTSPFWNVGAGPHSRRAAGVGRQRLSLSQRSSMWPSHLARVLNASTCEEPIPKRILLDLTVLSALIHCERDEMRSTPRYCALWIARLDNPHNYPE